MILLYLQKFHDDFPGVCVDIYYDEAQCRAWAAKGECSKNPSYMNVNCALSCNKCLGKNSHIREHQNVFFLIKQRCK